MLLNNTLAKWAIEGTQITRKNPPTRDLSEQPLPLKIHGSLFSRIVETIWNKLNVEEYLKQSGTFNLILQTNKENMYTTRGDNLKGWNTKHCLIPSSAKREEEALLKWLSRIIGDCVESGYIPQICHF